MYTELVKGRALVLALSIMTSVVASCGGGTTGTSSTDSVKFAGYAEQQDGNRAPFLSMTVSSGASGADLKNSGTDAAGDFAMVLPADERFLVVDVVGVGSTTVRRQQQGPGTLSTKLSVTATGGLASGLQFEAQVLAANLCPNLSANGDELVVIGEDKVVPCPATFSIASRDLSLAGFTGAVVATCGAVAMTVNSAQAYTAGELTLDISPALSAGCRDIRVVISHPQAPGLESLFLVR
jgi:hypothetical protein